MSDDTNRRQQEYRARRLGYRPSPPVMIVLCRNRLGPGRVDTILVIRGQSDLVFHISQVLMDDNLTPPLIWLLTLCEPWPVRRVVGVGVGLLILRDVCTRDTGGRKFCSFYNFRSFRCCCLLLAVFRQGESVIPSFLPSFLPFPSLLYWFFRGSFILSLVHPFTRSAGA